MELIKYLVARFIRKILLIFFIFKIKENKVIFYPMNGKYYCNLKYITNKMLDNKQNNIYWCAENEMNKSTRIKFCKKMSLSFFYHFFTAKIVIFNDALPSWIVKRSGQIYLQTWHGGGAYKKINVLYKNEVNKYKKKRSKDFFENIDYVRKHLKMIMEPKMLSI